MLEKKHKQVTKISFFKDLPNVSSPLKVSFKVGWVGGEAGGGRGREHDIS